MKNAIVMGSTGYIGSRVVKKLIENDISVLAIGRKNVSQFNEIINLQTEKLHYLEIEEENDIEKIEYWNEWGKRSDTVFLNFAWSGKFRLSDGLLEDQLKNISLSSKCIEIASKIGCVKYINAGSQEEFLFENYLKNILDNQPYNPAFLNYAFAKLLNRDMSRLKAYLEKISYINTRFSATIDVELSGIGYISQTLNKIKNNEPFEKPNNYQNIEIIDLDDLAQSYVLIGKYGQNKADYYIGNGEIAKLNDFFEIFSNMKRNISCNKQKLIKYNKLFDPSSFNKDIGLQLKNTNKLFMEVLKK